MDAFGDWAWSKAWMKNSKDFKTDTIGQLVDAAAVAADHAAGTRSRTSTRCTAPTRRSRQLGAGSQREACGRPGSTRPLRDGHRRQDRAGPAQGDPPRRPLVSPPCVGLVGLAPAIGWTRVQPKGWVAYVGLNSIGAGVILHLGSVIVGRSLFSQESRGKA